MFVIVNGNDLMVFEKVMCSNEALVEENPRCLSRFGSEIMCFSTEINPFMVRRLGF